MSATTAEQVCRWHGPAVLGYGFRPFSLGAGVWRPWRCCCESRCWLLQVSATLWAAAFGGFATGDVGFLTCPPLAARQPNRRP